MKNILFLMTLMAATLSLNAQSIVDTGKLWSNTHFHYNNFSFTTEFIHFTTDTAIGGIIYKRTEISTDSNHTTWSFYGYAREDAGKKVFYKVNAAQPEKLLYDLNCQTGDSVWVYTLYDYPTAIFDSMMYYVTGKDSLLIGNTYRKQYHLSIKTDGNYLEVEQWIDSTGTMSGMLHNRTGKVGGDGFTLLCFFEGGILKYHRPDYLSCYVITGIEPAENSQETVSIVPNPLTSESTLKLNGQTSGKTVEIGFFNSCGQLVFSADFRGELKLRRNQFAGGIYYYRIQAQERLIADGKFLVR